MKTVKSFRNIYENEVAWERIKQYFKKANIRHNRLDIQGFPVQQACLTKHQVIGKADSEQFHNTFIIQLNQINKT